MVKTAKNKSNQLFIVLAAVFITNALVAEFIGVKIFSLEKTLGIQAFSFSFFGQSDLSFQLTAGVLIWPVVFILTDVINEYFGKKAVMKLSYLAIGMIAYSFLIIYMAIQLVPADFWIHSHLNSITDDQNRNQLASEVGNYNTAYNLVFGQGLKIIVASLVAFFFAQLLDAVLFRRIKSVTGEKNIWLRATGSTFISQFFDSYIVLFIAFYLGAQWPLQTVLAIGTVNYIYKLSVAVLLTPFLYLLHACIKWFLGEEIAMQLRKNAMADA
ncbi:MAG: queuosine precursor transporter [Saprospiraceae bacterium]|nr:queuosine precursor transporter [Saprospiraceae bacterium]